MGAFRRIITIAVLAAGTSTPLRAQSESRLAGAWMVHTIRTYKSLHTGDTTTVDETAQLILHPRGDSVFGFWQIVASSAEGSSQPRTVRGVVLRDGARVQVDLEPHDDDGFFTTMGREIVEWLKTHVHNAPTTIPVLEFVVRGDSLVGTRRSMALNDGTMGQARPFHGVRASQPPP